MSSKREAELQEETATKSIKRPRTHIGAYLTLDGHGTEERLAQVERFMKYFEIDERWRNFLSQDLGSNWFAALVGKYQTAAQKQMVLPALADIFSWTRHCAPEDVKVVIVGQDPYPTLGNAHGLAFSVAPGKSIPKSLGYIYKELERSIEGFVIPNHGNLEKWAKQGVLLLNIVLTVAAGQPCSHADLGWNRFTRGVMERLNTENHRLVFMQWGRVAQKAFLPNKDRHLVLHGIHPSPRAQFRTTFVGCGHFTAANAYLQKHSLRPIDWSL
ncbi:uracil-DNA glycosylase [Testudinid alphaherpesvirus 3]|uniref:Uracil-DNA glycosylase n=1 Tax=Testudinid alphaherpesvirus 3 TaxID=2560801 RepID=A0A0K1R1A5_9ALPH|nr:uracil-DNA glycosylase [Testudinid alphaherpesvirus 3]AIU39293.1 uracil-DNA glycosylase [Testudinid alphaherpesvirus 3]AKV40673.1 uracil DNA glycosylase [Testudinid alphaherpesvirus 3]